MKIIFLLINIVGFSFVSFAGTWKQRGGLIKPSGEIKKKNWLDLADSHKQSIKESGGTAEGGEIDRVADYFRQRPSSGTYQNCWLLLESLSIIKIKSPL